MALDTILRDLPDHVAAEIRAVLPDLRHCEATAGKFDLRRLLDKGVRAPAVMVSLLRLGHDETFAGAHHAYLLHMAAFVVTKDAMGLPRDAAAAAIAQAILVRVGSTNWGLDECGEARDVRAEPIVSEGTLKAAASLWAVTWRQPCVLSAIETPGPMPIDLYVGHDPEDASEYVRPEELR